MKNQNTTKMSTIALILLLTISATIIALPTVTAQEPQTEMTFPYLGAVPNPVGINQEVLLHIGITESRSSTEQGWENMTVTVTRPDGQIETLGPFRTDSTGGTGTIYVPTLVGTYLMQTNFPEQTVPVQAFFAPFPTMVTYLASTSETLELEVQQDPIEYYPGIPLPDEYWTRPINAQFREWSKIAGDWLQAPENLYAPYNDAPETAHILWTKPLTTGGLVGGDVGPLDQAYTCGDAYQGKFQQSVIIAGRLYYNRFHTGFGASPPQQGVVCVDLHTGEELWFKNNTRISFGQTLYFSSVNQHGAFAYLWDGSWNCYDAFTGEWVYSMINVPSGTQRFGPDGEILRYNVNTNAGWMALWNSTAAVNLGGGFTSHTWAPEGRTVNASDPSAYSWNVSIPTGLSGSVQALWPGDRVIGANASPTAVTLWGIDLRPATRGQLLFNNTWIPPASWAEGGVTVGGFGGGFVAFSQEERIAVIWVKEFRQHYAFSLETGDYKWGPSIQEYYLNALEDTIADQRHIAYGKFYCASVSGIVYAYDAQTGDLEWQYEAVDPYSEILWANNWWMRPLFISDGKIYVGHGEHSAIDPKPRGAPFICLNATSGEEIFRIDGAFRQTRWGGRALMGDSIIATMDTYDQRIYAIGKGPSTITVASEPRVIKKGEYNIIEGRVTDVSPGTEEYSIRARFPNGVPVVADESMSEWMKYVYLQFAPPTTVQGVSVKIEIIDPDHEYSWIGTATTDATGKFTYSWIPQKEGPYMIIATFEGSAGYYGSHDLSYLTVESAPAPYPTIPPYPGYQGPTAQDVANRVVSTLPANPTSEQIGQAVVNQLPAYPEPTVVPEYTMIDIVLILLVAVAIIIGLVCMMILRKQK
jgi:hypothetical protein